MSKVHLDIPDDTRDALTAYAQARGITIAAAIRIILHDALQEQQS
jgi:antitoxin component of RelBE/YafQ-DinJ toxin-antitoxin module